MAESHILVVKGIAGSEVTTLSFNNVLSAISHSHHTPEFQWTWQNLIVTTFLETAIISDNSLF